LTAATTATYIGASSFPLLFLINGHLKLHSDIVPIRRALLSVSDKRGLIDLARELVHRGVELLASGGTRSALSRANVDSIEIAEYTGQPEILGGRVKTLHPKLHAGILARRDLAEDLAALELQGVPPIDLVIVNLYPFEQTIADPAVSIEDAVEQIDIGGPSLIRGAAKNHPFVAVLIDPDQYPALIDQLSRFQGTTLAFRRSLAASVFERTSTYDRAIADHLARSFAADRNLIAQSSLNKVSDATSAVSTSAEPADSASAPPAPGVEGAGSADEPFPAILHLRFNRRAELRYGENPHQKAAFYVDPNAAEPCPANARVLHGKELSYNNLLDLDSAYSLIRSFERPAAVILKHNNPCGAGEADRVDLAFELAYEGDPVSAFGGIVGLNRAVDLATAERLCVEGRFIEAIVAPSFDQDALALLTTRPTWKKSVRLIEIGAPIGPSTPRPSGFDLRRIEGGLLVQEWDSVEADPAAGEVVTKRSPNESELRDLAFAWKVCRAVKSNAIVLARDSRIVGVGAGQMSRLDSVQIAVSKAGQKAAGAVLASDAFFPFRDGPDAAAKAGVVAIIQPGGSRRDSETVAACDEHGIAMILTGRRHFRH
jgi:phosphoribosylaminoimidazolecarboxamide formyltransferase/IMP cyclohydrolase